MAQTALSHCKGEELRHTVGRLDQCKTETQQGNQISGASAVE